MLLLHEVQGWIRLNEPDNGPVFSVASVNTSSIVLCCSFYCTVRLISQTTEQGVIFKIYLLYNSSIAFVKLQLLKSIKKL